jgi:hypothetical protein
MWNHDRLDRAMLEHAKNGDTHRPRSRRARGRAGSYFAGLAERMKRKGSSGEGFGEGSRERSSRTREPRSPD